MEPQTIPEQLLFSTVRIELEKESSFGVGTGFIVEYRVGKKFGYFVVTNKHVIDDTQKIRLIFIRREGARPSFGSGLSIEIEEDEWKKHPEFDLAVLPFSYYLKRLSDSGENIYFTRIDDSLFPSEEKMRALDAFEEVVFIGYPIGMWDSENLLPIFRKGTTATPVYVEFEGKPKFLIDANIFPGSSGSPVFLLNIGTYFDKERRGTVVGHRVLFLGVLSSGYAINSQGELGRTPIPTQPFLERQRQMIGLGCVIKSSVIMDYLEELLSAHARTRD